MDRPDRHHQHAPSADPPRNSVRRAHPLLGLRPGESVDNRIVGDDIVIDLGSDGEPVGYDIQHASRHAEAIAEALGTLHRQHAA